MNALDIAKIIEHNFCSISDISFIELRLGAGYRGISERRADVFVVSTLPSKMHRTTAYEIKTSRTDFLGEKKKPNKQRGARLFADEFYYVTPVGLLAFDEIPDWAGLIEVLDDTSRNTYGRVKVIIPAPTLEKARPSWGLCVSMVRNQFKRDGKQLP